MNKMTISIKLLKNFTIISQNFPSISLLHIELFHQNSNTFECFSTLIKTPKIVYISEFKENKFIKYSPLHCHTFNLFSQKELKLYYGIFKTNKIFLFMMPVNFTLILTVSESENVFNNEGFNAKIKDIIMSNKHKLAEYDFFSEVKSLTFEKTHNDITIKDNKLFSNFILNKVKEIDKNLYLKILRK